MYQNKSPAFNLKPFAKDDFERLLLLRNLIYPDHPLSLASMCHHEKTRSEKIKHKHWVWEKDNTILASTLYTQWEDCYHPQKFVLRIFIHPDHQRQ